MSDLFREVESLIVSENLLPRGARALTAVSGGADSMVMLDLMHRLAARYDWKLVVAHFNHGLRGADSDADEAFVKEAARSLGWPFAGECWERSDARRPGDGGPEMAARRVRHRFFGRTALKHDSRFIALGHTEDDQLETFFLRVLRGGGGRGLAGMRVRSPAVYHEEIELIRPLLRQTRDAVRAHAAAHRIVYREDRSNATDAFARNRVRHRLIPVLDREFGPGARRNLLRSMEITGAESDHCADAASRWLAATRPEVGFERLDPAIQRQCIVLQLEALSIQPRFAWVEHWRVRSDVPLEIAPGMRLRRSSAGRLEWIDPPVSPTFGADERRLSLGAGATSGTIRFGGLEIRWSIERLSSPVSRPRPPVGVEWFDFEKVGGEVRLRHWRPGDRFEPSGLGHAARLQDLFTNLKIRRERRYELVVAETAGGELFWVEGVRIAERFKLDIESVHRLKWNWSSGREGFTSRPSA